MQAAVRHQQRAGPSGVVPFEVGGAKRCVVIRPVQRGDPQPSFAVACQHAAMAAPIRLGDHATGCIPGPGHVPRSRVGHADPSPGKVVAVGRLQPHFGGRSDAPRRIEQPAGEPDPGRSALQIKGQVLPDTAVPILRDPLDDASASVPSDDPMPRAVGSLLGSDQAGRGIDVDPEQIGVGSGCTRPVGQRSVDRCDLQPAIDPGPAEDGLPLDPFGRRIQARCLAGLDDPEQSAAQVAVDEGPVFPARNDARPDDLRRQRRAIVRIGETDP